MKLLRQLLALYNPKEKIILLFFLFMNVSCSLLELVGIGAVVPFILLLTKPEMVETNRYIKFIYDIVQPDSFRDFMVIMAGCLIIFFILKNIYMLVVFTLQQLFLKHKYETMTNDLFISYLLKPYKFFFSHAGSELLRNVQSVQTIVGMFTLMFNLVAEFLTITILAIFLLVINPLQTVLLGGGLLICVALGLKLLKHKTHKLGHEKLLVDEALISNITQGLGSIKETRILGNEQIIMTRNAQTVKQLGRLNVTTNLLGVVPRFYIESLAVATVLLIMIFMLRTGWQTERIILELSLFGMVAVRLMPSVTRISVAISLIRAYIPSFSNVYTDILIAQNQRLTKNIDDLSATKHHLQDGIELRNVCFAYNNERQILDKISLKIAKNQKVGFIGSSGSGKTTLIDLIIGLLEPDSGKILIDGMDIHNNIRTWQANIGYIPQQIFIFNETIRRNIALGIAESDIDATSIQRVVKIAQLEKLLERLPEGLNTKVGENGIKLSGGERQRLGIARALYRDPDILIMDEATAALDNEAEQEFIAAINNLAGQKTILIIAHRLTTIENCDIVFSVNNGKIKVNNNA